jgi:hypothetical protein
MKLTISQMDTIYTRNGSSRDVIKKVAQDAGITEAEAGAIAQVLEERRAAKIPKGVTESAPAAASENLAGYGRQVLEAAKDHAVRANVAEAQIEAGHGARVPHNDLVTLASMHFPG